MSPINNKLVSVIRPCFNAEKWINNTINSVLTQSYETWELIIIDDGSTDNTAQLIKKISDSRISCILKSNTGVSDTRNKGLKLAKGEFVLFLDADDILSIDFLEKRILFLEQNQDVGFCCSEVIKIDEIGNIYPNKNKKWKGVSTNIQEDVLSYNSEIITCPSNYLFRKNILVKNSIFFNSNLSSSADRFFLIALSNYTKGGLIKEMGFLYYRVHKNSMSNCLSPYLIQDNILFQKMILQLNNISAQLKKKFRFKTNYIYAGSYYKLRQFIPCLKFSCKAFYISPWGFIKQMFNRN